MMFCMKHTSNNNNTLALPQPCNSHQHYRTYVNFVLVLNKHSRRFHHWFAFGNRFYLRARCPRFTKTLFYRWKLQFLQKPYFFCTSSCFTHTTPSTTAIVIQLNVFREKESLVYEDAMTLNAIPILHTSKPSWTVTFTKPNIVLNTTHGMSKFVAQMYIRTVDRFLLIEHSISCCVSEFIFHDFCILKFSIAKNNGITSNFLN